MITIMMIISMSIEVSSLEQTIPGISGDSLRAKSFNVISYGVAISVGKSIEISKSEKLLIFGISIACQVFSILNLDPVWVTPEMQWYI